MSVKTTLRVDTELGTLTVPLLECDNCQSEAVEELAGGWLKLESIGPPLKLASRTPEGGYHFCSFQCLNTAVQVVITNLF